MQHFQTLFLEKNTDVLTVTLNCKNKAHTVNSVMIQEIIQLADLLRDTNEIKFVVFTNRGKIFSPGADFVEQLEHLHGKTPNSEQLSHMQIIGQEMMNKLERLEQITISALHGSSYGTGIAIMMTTDFRLMTECSVLNLPERDIDIFLTWSCTPKLVKEVGVVKAKELIMLGDDVSAEACYNIGFINKVVAADSMNEEVEQIIQKLRKRGNPATRNTKKLVNASVASRYW
ncbi:enoyl-CoA hydratase/isomerase family protein [Solibacillus sp. FSL H8-0538]|uniref:enoyl-CoA hydratase/isomerase family protein n=1 Tax=Solibacillus sp. FSL H8-0538 TaxID=2921400 RepID=UPI0030F60866